MVQVTVKIAALFIVEAVLLSSTCSTSNEDFIYHCDDMFETADYLITLNKKIDEYIKKPNPTIIPCLQSFSKYIDYMADKIEVGSKKEVKIIKTFGKEVTEGPSFIENSIDVDVLREEHSWNNSIAQELRDAFNEANAMWARLTAALAEHVQETVYLQKNAEACDVGDDCNTCLRC